MTGINHALTGTAIGLAIPNPIGLTLALASHFIMDALPHFGLPMAKKRSRPELLSRWLTIEGILLSGLAIWLMSEGVGLIIYASLFLAILPDLTWVAPDLFDRLIGRKIERPTWWFDTFHKRIQKFESERFFFVDALWFIGVIAIIINLLNL